MSFDHGASWRMLGSMRRRGEVKQVPKGTWRRVFRFARPYRRDLLIFLVIIIASALIGVITPILAGRVVNEITGHGTISAVVEIAIVIAGLAVVDAGFSFVQRWYSARIGEGL